MVNKDAENFDMFPDLDELTSLYARDLGLIWITDLGKKFPTLQTLDVSNNKIYSLKNLDELNIMDMLVEVNMNSNPINVHKGLDEMLQDAVPAIEVVNNKQIRESGASIKNQIDALKKQLLNWGLEHKEAINFEEILKDKDVAK